MQDAAIFLLMYVVFPLWVMAGFADWACHVRAGIAITCGLKEHLLHWLMYAEIGAGMVAVALIEIDDALLAIVLAVIVVHEMTEYWDLRYSTMIRDVGPFEQMVHSFLELLPLASLALLTVIAWQANTIDEWTLQFKREPWPIFYLACALGAGVLFNGVPLVEETRSCLRVRATRRTRSNPEPR